MSRGTVVVELIATTAAAVERFIDEGTTFPDANTSAGFGQICEGLIQLLNEGIYPFDGGQLYAAVEAIARRVHWDLNDSEINYDQEEEEE